MALFPFLEMALFDKAAFASPPDEAIFGYLKLH